MTKVDMNLAMEQLPDYIPNLKDLETIFPKLPPPEKVNSNELIVPVEAQVLQQAFADGSFGLERLQKARVAKLIFVKFRENEKFIWVYRGIIKHL